MNNIHTNIHWIIRVVSMGYAANGEVLIVLILLVVFSKGTYYVTADYLASDHAWSHLNRRIIEIQCCALSITTNLRRRRLNIVQNAHLYPQKKPETVAIAFPLSKKTFIFEKKKLHTFPLSVLNRLNRIRLLSSTFIFVRDTFSPSAYFYLTE